MVGEISDPLADCYVSGLDVETKETPTYDNESTAVTLTKIARLLPAAVTVALAVHDADDMAAWAARHDLLFIDAADIFQNESTVANILRAICSVA